MSILQKIIKSIKVLLCKVPFQYEIIEIRIFVYRNVRVTDQGCQVPGMRLSHTQREISPLY